MHGLQSANIASYNMFGYLDVSDAKSYYKKAFCIVYKLQIRAPDPKFGCVFRGSNSVVEFLPSKQGVAGSNPVSRSKTTQL